VPTERDSLGPQLVRKPQEVTSQEGFGVAADAWRSGDGVHFPVEMAVFT